MFIGTRVCGLLDDNRRLKARNYHLVTTTKRQAKYIKILCAITIAQAAFILLDVMCRWL